MKKIFIASNNGSRQFELKIKKTLELLGYEVMMPKVTKAVITDRENFIHNYQIVLKKYITNSDCILVLNPTRDDNRSSILNNITGLSFLEMYDSYRLGHEVYLYEAIQNVNSSKEINGFKPINLEANLLNIERKENNLLKYFTKKQLEEIKKCENIYSKAFIICYIVFQDKKDKGGKPYFEHLFRVSQKLHGEVEQTAGLFHDIVEDTDITYRDLLDVGFPLDVVEIVKLVTKEKIDKSGLTEEEKLKLYDEEINKIIDSRNIHAIRLKYADMTDNFNPDRIKELPEEKQEWFNKKYGLQLVKLKKAKKEGDIL